MSTYSESKPGRTVGKSIRKVYDVNGNLTSTITSDRSFSYTDTATKGLNPKWRSDIRANRNATTTLSGERYFTRRYKPGSMRVSKPFGAGRDYQTQDGMGLSGHTTLPGDPSGLLVTSSENMAKARFLSDLISAQSTLRGMVTLGEIGQTIRMLRNPALAIRKGLDSYFTSVKKRTRRVPERSKARIAGQTWLEYSFGWSQLHRDVVAANAAFERISKSDYGRVPLRAYGVSETMSWAGLVFTSAGMIGLRGRPLLIDRVETIFRGATLAVPTSPQYLSARTLGFTPEEFLPTVWELIPYSFLVDYFTNIGDVIQGWSWHRSGLAWSNRTYRKSKIRLLSSEPDPALYGANPTWLIEAFSPSISEVERTSVSRAAYFGGFAPSVTFELPVGNKIRKLLNVSALLALRRL